MDRLAPEALARWNAFAETAALRFSLVLDHSRLEKLRCFHQAVLKQNRILNLTSITELDDFLLKHYLDSLSILEAAPDFAAGAGRLALLDVGTGAGFPGVVLAICLDGLRVTMIDSTRKKIRFVEAVLEKLQLAHCRALHARVEDLPRTSPGEYRQTYDVVVARAVEQPEAVAKAAAQLLKKGGRLILYRGPDTKNEGKINSQAKRAGLSDPQEFTFALNLFGQSLARRLLVYRR